MNLADARGLTFDCKPGCGFCCTANPLVQPREAPALPGLVVRADDGTLRIPLSGPACSALRADRACGVYEARPSVCRLYPYQVHAGRRLQVSVSLACPGISREQPGEDAEPGAARAAELALAQPGAPEMAQRARETFAELDRRMREWEVHATPDQLRAAYLPHAPTLARVANLPAFFAGLEPGDLVLGSAPARAVEGLFAAEPEADLLDLLAEGARDAFDEPDTVVWVEPDLSWTRVAHADGAAHLTRHAGGDVRRAQLALGDIPLAWDEDAADALARYLERLMRRDHTEGAALWLVDASGYQVTPAAAYGRVLAEASLQVALRAGVLALDERRDAVDAALARRGIAAYETAYHSLPTVGAIL